ncbi:ATP-dependent zinc metalloprotease FtsH [Rubripirellula lacrimiformis]|uniref:ATP-dependent zinc metalloprotease FtsH n=1 Tax=Rubripirellula lacrimiformis TaxID=1930273 RepID=A0A517NI35_9BACT|nr:cell division protein FtsH [Rubripirellula lacrimiformis]QDT06799.1 ATP-dependent zinc metalloprotease FtsH [Rubripirellula lacrimiformis]
MSAKNPNHRGQDDAGQPPPERAKWDASQWDPEQLADRVATAYHEAGHAVMATLLGRPIQKVTIEPGKLQTGATRLGLCQIQKGRSKASKDWLEDEVLILYAGMVAEAHFTGNYCQSGAAEDLRAIQRLVRSRPGSVRQMERYQRRFLDKTEHILRDDAYAEAIKLIATELVVRTTISGRAVRHFLDQSIKHTD